MGCGRTALLLPGLAGGFELLGPLARCLARHFRVIAFQLRGEDDPFALRQRFKLPDLVNDVREFLDWMGLEAPALMGVSFGGVLALEFATRFPLRLQSLVVQGAGCRFEKGLLPQLAGQILSSYPLPSDNAFVNQFFNLLFGGRQSATPIFDFVTRQCWQTDQSVMAHRFQLARRFDVTDRLNRIRVPVLALSGERDLLVSAPSLKEMETSIPECTVVRLPGCGHLAFATQPQRVADETRRFLLDTGR